MKKQYLYPQNLKARSTLWLWSLRDLVVTGVALVLSVLAFSQLGFVLPLGLTLGYAFLTIRFDDTTILAFIILGIRFFIASQQQYTWNRADVGKRSFQT